MFFTERGLDNQLSVLIVVNSYWTGRLFFPQILVYLFIFCVCWVFIAVCRLSFIAANGGYSLLSCVGFSL